MQKWGAFENLKPETKELIVPIIESKMIAPESLNEWWSTFRTLGSYLQRKIGHTKFIYDFNTAFEKIGEVQELKDEKNLNLIEHCIEKMEKSNLYFVPCIHFDSPSWIIESVLSSNQKEIAVRIRCHDFNSPLEDLIKEWIVTRICRDLKAFCKFCLPKIGSKLSNLGLKY